MAGTPSYRSRATSAVKNWRTHTEMPTLIIVHRQRLPAPRGRVRERPRNVSSTPIVWEMPFSATQPSTTNPDSTRTTPGPLGRVSLAKLKRSFSAPPVKTHP